MKSWWRSWRTPLVDKPGTDAMFVPHSYRDDRGDDTWVSTNAFDEALHHRNEYELVIVGTQTYPELYLFRRDKYLTPDEMRRLICDKPLDAAKLHDVWTIPMPRTRQEVVDWATAVVVIRGAVNG